MAKPQKKNVTNFFTQMIKEKGENFLDQMSVRDMQYSAVRIFKELSRANIDIMKHGHYFCVYQFNRSLYAEAQKKYETAYISYTGLEYYINTMMQSGMQIPENYSFVCETHRRTLEVYQVIMYGLDEVLVTQQPDVLYRTINIISQYRNNI